MNHWHAIIIRKRILNGPGVITLYKNYDIFDTWECYTGGKKLDPHQYGGLTPPLNYMMVELIEYRKHPMFDYSLDMARILPVGCGKAAYPKRTWDISRDPFMLHPYKTKSTGCPTPLPKYWDSFKRAFNKARKEDNFLISVRESIT